MPRQLAQIPERDADGEIAAIYDDMRRVMGLPMVNLVYRHLATMPGALPWVWSLIRPQIRAGRIGAAADRIAASLEAPRFTPLSVAVLRAAGLSAVDIVSVAQVIGSYNRGNTLNIVNLTVVRLALDLPPLPPAPRAGAQVEEPLPPEGAAPALPPILRLERLDPATSARIGLITRLHGGEDVTPSLYLHLAHWPGFLALISESLTDALRDGTIAHGRDLVYRQAVGEASAIAPLLATDAPFPAGHLPALRAALDTFTQRLIPEMIVVGAALMRTLPA